MISKELFEKAHQLIKTFTTNTGSAAGFQFTNDKRFPKSLRNKTFSLTVYKHLEKDVEKDAIAISLGEHSNSNVVGSIHWGIKHCQYRPQIDQTGIYSFLEQVLEVVIKNIQQDPRFRTTTLH